MSSGVSYSDAPNAKPLGRYRSLEAAADPGAAQRSPNSIDADPFRSATKTKPKLNRSPAQRVRFGQEEQRHKRALTFKKVGASDM